MTSMTPNLAPIGFRSRKDSDDLFWAGAGGDVVVGRLDLHLHVSDATADEIRFESMAAKFLDDVCGRVGSHNCSGGMR